MLIRLVLTDIQPVKHVKINKETYDHPEAVFGQHSDGHTFLVNFDIFKWLYRAYSLVYLHHTWGLFRALSAMYDYVGQ